MAEVTEANYNTALSHITTPNVAELRAAITGWTVGNLRTLLERVHDNEGALKSLRSAADVRKLLTDAAQAARKREIDESQKKQKEALEGVEKENREKIEKAFEALNKNVADTIAAHLRAIDVLINSTAAPATTGSVVAPVTPPPAPPRPNPLVSLLERVPVFGSLFSIFGNTPAERSENFDRGFNNLMSLIPGIGETFRARNALKDAQQILREELGARFTGTVTLAQITAFMRRHPDAAPPPSPIPGLPPIPLLGAPAWKTAFIGNVQTVKALPNPTFTWEDVANVSDAQRKSTEVASKQLEERTLKAFAPVSVSALTFETGTNANIARKQPDGRWQIAVTREALSGASLTGPAAQLKEALQGPMNNANVVRIVAEDDPVAFVHAPRAADVTVNIPSGSTPAYPELNTVAGWFRTRNLGVREMRQDTANLVRGAGSRVALSAVNGSMVLAWNSTTTYASLTNLPEDDIRAAAPGAQWRYDTTASAWNAV